MPSVYASRRHLSCSFVTLPDADSNDIAAVTHTRSATRAAIAPTYPPTRSSPTTPMPHFDNMSRCPAHLRFVAGLLLAVFGLTALGGCATRDASRCFPTPPHQPFSPSGEAVPPDRWWTTFEDPNLNRQVELALGGNYTLAAAMQRLRASRALVRREASDLFADVDGVVDVSGDFGPGPSRWNMAWGLDASYQVDLWGQIQSRVEAEQLRAEATHADYHAVSLTLAAEVARTWFSLVEAHAQLELLDEQITTNLTGLVSQELRFGLGFVRSADVLRQRQLVESTYEQQVVAQARVELLEHQLAVLLGQLPQQARFDPGSELPELPPLPDTGLPSELLMRRPDVQRDYLAFMAADRDLASAISAQYPRISLTGAVINAAENPETLFRDWFAAIGGQLIAPLLDGGQRRAEVDRTGAVVWQRFNEYGETMLNAFREVEDNLARERYQILRLERLYSQVDLAQQASAQLREQYLIGDADYLDVLSAIQAQQRLQRETLSARLDLVLIRIGLYLALAGNFDTRPQAVAELPAEQAAPGDVPPAGASGTEPAIGPRLDTGPELPFGEQELPPPVELAPEIDIDE